MNDLDIFINAPDGLTDAELAAYFDEACGSDAELRARVEALRAAGGEAGPEFLEKGPLQATPELIDDSAPVAEKSGDVIGNYKLLQQIGEGGFGVVYMAEQLKPVKRKVALKIIKLGMDTKQVVARFEVERQALALMDHPNIAKVHDAGATETGRPFFVMELVRGIPITEFCDGQKLNTADRLNLFIDVCHAVQHAHQKGIIHRDLKPSNVMVTLHDDKAVVKVIDFGVAKATHTEMTDKTLFTRFEQFIGTPAYMSPEQAQMSGLDIDTRSDIYALGVLLYELLTGVTPFDSETLRKAGYAEILRIIREEDPPKPSTRIRTSAHANRTNSLHHSHHASDRALRGDLDWIVMKAMEKDRARRYDTANGLAMDVGRHLANEPVDAARPSASYRLRKYVRRNSGLVTSLAAVFFVLTIGVIGMSVLFVEMRTQKEVAVSKGEEARLSGEAAESFAQLVTEQKNAAAAQSENWKRQAYAANVMRAHQYWKDQQAGRARELLEACPPELRDWEWRWLSQLVDRDDLVADGLGGLLGAWFAPDGRSVLSCREGGRYQLWDRSTGEERFRVDVGGSWVGREGWRGAPGAFSMDGKDVFLGGSKTSGRWNLATGERLASFDEDFPINAANAFGVTFHSTPQRIIGLVIGVDGSLQIHEFSDDEVQSISVLSRKNPAWIFSVNFSRDGTHVAIGEFGFRQHVYRVDSGARVGAIPGPAIAFGRNSDIVAVMGWDSLHLKDASTLETHWETRWETGLGTAVEVARDGRHVYVGGSDGNLVVRDAATGDPVGTHGGHLSSVVSIDESPDESEVLTASADGAIRVWPRETVTEPFVESLVLSGHSGHVGEIAFSPDGTRLVSAGNDGMTKVWHTSTGQELLTIHLADQYPVADFNPDPKQLHVVTGGSRSEPLRIWDIDSGQTIRLLQGASRGASWRRWVKYSPDGTRVAASIADASLLVWDAHTGEELIRIEHGAEGGFAFSPDGSKIAFSVTRNYDHLGICDARSGDLLKTLKEGGGAGLGTLTFSPDGTKLAAGGDDHIVRVWDVLSGELLHQLKRHTLEVSAVAFSRDPRGSRLFTGGRDESLRVWDTESGDELLVIPTGSEIFAIAVSAEDKSVATAGGDGFIRLWETERPTPTIRKKRRIVAAARQLVDERIAQFPSPREVNESLFSDDSIDPVRKKVALEILQARRGVTGNPETNHDP